MSCSNCFNGASAPIRDRRRWAAVFFLVICSVLAGQAAIAHDVWLGVPSSSQPGELVRVHLFQGHGFQGQGGESEPLARNDRRLERFYAIDPSAAESDLPGLHGGDPAGVLRPKEPGTWTVVYQSKTASHITEAEVFNRHLMLEGLNEVLDQRRRAGDSDKPGRELYSRTMKALWSVGPARITDAIKGLEVELVLEEVTQDRVLVQALSFGRPLVDVLVDLHPLRPGPEAPMASVRTDVQGRAVFSVPPGTAEVWVATAVVAEPLRQLGDRAADTQADLDWRTYFTALTFPRP